MKIVMLAVGTRGDVQPYIPLGIKLQELGYSVRLAAGRNLESLTENTGLEFFPLSINFGAIFNPTAQQKNLKTGLGLRSLRKLAEEFWANEIDRLLDELWEASQGTEAIVGGNLSLWALEIAQALQIPSVLAIPTPAHATGDFSCPQFGFSLSLGRKVNVLTYRMHENFLWSLFGEATNNWRSSKLKMPRSTKNPFHLPLWKHAHSLYGFSPSVVSKPTDWNENQHITGYWIENSTKEYSPPPDLEDFINSGQRPIYVGFGSMSSSDPRKMRDTVLKALEITKQRAVLGAMGGAIECRDLPENVFPVESIKHTWLFPKMAALVHHGGAGTTGTALHAGIPSIVVPFFFDQAFWGKRIELLGVGTKSIRPKHLNAKRLADAITLVTQDSKIQQAASALGETIRSEDGVARTAELLGSFLRQSH